MALPQTDNGLRKRVTTLEEKFQALVAELNNQLNRMTQDLSIANEVINAVTQLVGEADVKKAVDEDRKAKRRAIEERQDAAVKQLVDKKVLVVQESVTELSTVVAQETDGAGNVVRSQYNVSAIKDASVVALLLGKKVGETFTYAGSTIEVKEIYYFDKDRADEVMKEEAEKAQSAQQTVDLTKAASAELATPSPDAGV